MQNRRRFPGDNDQKRVARAVLYTRLCHMWKAGGEWPEGKIITLVGEGAEINLLRHFMRVRPQNAVFIDKDKKAVGLDRAQEWKRATIVRGDILHYLRSMHDEIAFINLDFNGHFLVGKTEEIFEEIRNRLAPGGAVSFTFTRGHESSKITKHWRFLRYHALQHAKETRDALTTDPSLLRDEIRFRGYEHLIQSLLGDNVVPVLKLRYSRHRELIAHRGGKSLGIILFQNVPDYMRTTEWLKAYRTHLFPEELAGRINSVGIKNRLREFVFWGTNLGLSSRQVGSLLNLTPKTVGAYKANATRKTVIKIGMPVPGIEGFAGFVHAIPDMTN